MTPRGRRVALTPRGRLSLVGAVVLAIVLVAGAVLYALHGNGGKTGPAAASATPSGTASASPSAPAEPAQVVVARTAFTLWARPTLGYARWWQELRPHLSAQGAYDLQGTDPARLPRLSVTGTPTLAGQANGVYAVVRIPTDRGSFRVSVSRATSGQNWRLDGIGFPRAAVHR